MTNEAHPIHLRRQRRSERSARGIAQLALATALLHGPVASHAATLTVPGDHATIQAAIEAAVDGDVVSVSAGEHEGDIDFLGKAIRVVGRGEATVLRGSGLGSVVRFTSGEGNDSVLDSVLVTGGNAQRGGGVLVLGSSPTIVRSFVMGNRASAQGSGIHVGSGSPLLYNNLVAYSTNSGGDPHGIQVSSGEPRIVNNTIVRGDSNGMLFSSGSAPVVWNNVIARNGSAGRGRGICDFSSRQAVIAFNVFYRNRIAAFLRDGRDWRYATGLQRERPDDPGVFENMDGKPSFAGRAHREIARVTPSTFALATDPEERRRAFDAGDPSVACNDLDGSRNDIGFTGGPFASPSTGLPGAGDCGNL